MTMEEARTRGHSGSPRRVLSKRVTRWIPRTVFCLAALYAAISVHLFSLHTFDDGKETAPGQRTQKEKGDLIRERQRLRHQKRMREIKERQEAALIDESMGDHIDYTLVAVPNSSTLKQPKIYAETNTLVTVILTARHNFEQRQAIRETWGKGHAIYFVIGGPPEGEDEKVQSDLFKEQAQFQDIIDSIHQESYRSLPYKLRFAYKFIIQSMPKVRWILKVDDDMIARIDTLDEVLLQYLNHERAVVVGRIISNSTVHKEGKWADYKYPKDTYPLWPQGSCGHVVSRKVAEYICGMEDIIYYQGEDISVGIWLDEAEDLPVIFVRSLYFQNHGRCDEKEWLVIGHKVTPQMMRSCHLSIDRWNPDERQQKEFVYLQSEKQRLELPEECLGKRTPRFEDC